MVLFVAGGGCSEFAGGFSCCASASLCLLKVFAISKIAISLVIACESIERPFGSKILSSASSFSLLPKVLLYRLAKFLSRSRG